MKVHSGTATSVAAVFLFAGSVGAQQPGASGATRLTRQQAIAEALAHSNQLDISREQAYQARARRVSGIGVPDPALSAAYDQISGPVSFSGAPSKPVSLGLSIPFPDKFRLNTKIGNADVRNFELNHQLQQQLVAFTTSVAYDSLLVAQRHYNEQQETLQLAQDFLTRTQARFNAGSAPKLDVFRAQVDVAQSQNDLVDAQRAVTVAQASLNRQLNRPVSAAIAPADSLEVPPALPDSASIEGLALSSRPELRQIQAQRAGAAAATTLAREFWSPDLTFSVQRDYATTGAKPLFTTGIALPLPIFYPIHSRGDIAVAQHFERELAATDRDVRSQIALDVRQAYATASSAVRQVVFLRDQLLPATREAFRVANASYSLGGASALDVLSARRDLIDAQAKLSDALAAANTAYADLQRALGVPLTQIGNTP